jgi:hypothetical protein
MPCVQARHEGVIAAQQILGSSFGLISEQPLVEGAFLQISSTFVCF